MGTALDRVVFTPLQRVATPGGDVLHGMKADDAGYTGFGEVYFSLIGPGVIKGWKRHHEMTLNLLVPSGRVRFVVFDGADGSDTLGHFREETLCSEIRYGRLTVPPGLWLAFEGAGAGTSIVANVADMPHDPAEVDRMNLSDLEYQWT